MRKLGELLIAASVSPRNENGMVISAPGAISIAARTLNDMAEPYNECDDVETILDLHQERLDICQPRAAAYTLETFAKHLGMLRDAVDRGDADMVGKFFNLYVFE